VAHLKASGSMEFINCGHVQPLLVSNGAVTRFEESNLPVGLLPAAAYATSRRTLQPGDHLILVTDGVTEAEDPNGEFFGSERLEKAVAAAAPFDEVFNAVRSFCAGTPLGDDCTVLELTYQG